MNERENLETVIAALGIDRVDPAGYPCPGCGAVLPPFALIVDEEVPACANCLIDRERDILPPFEISWDDVRGERAAALAATDWTQQADVPPATREAWRAYRQAWRDITLQTCRPADVVRPMPPKDDR